MKRCYVVKIVSLISVAWTLASPGASELYPRYECGNYRARGAFILNRQHQFIFSLRNGTTSPMEFIVLGGEPKEKLSHIGASVEIEFFVPEPIENTGRPIVYFKEFSSKGDVEKDSIKPLARLDCTKPH